MIWVDISTTVAGFTELNSVQLVIIRKKKNRQDNACRFYYQLTHGQ